jgi:hypothetical protein
VRLYRASTLSLGRLFWYAAPVERAATAANGDRTYPAIGEVETQGAQTGGAAETEAHGNQRVGPEGRPEQGSGCPADAPVRKSMRPAHRTVCSADSRGGE